MLDSIIASIDDFIIESKQLNKWRTWKSYVLAVAAVAALVASIFIPNDTLQVVVSSLAGVALFFGLYVIWFTGIPEKYAERLEFRTQYDIFYRRRVIVVAFLVWVIILLLLSSWIPSPLLGGIAVAVFITFFRLFTPTEEEREETERIQNEIYEQTIEEEIEKRKKKKSRLAPPKRKEEDKDDESYDDYDYDETDDEWDDLEDDDRPWEEGERYR